MAWDKPYIVIRADESGGATIVHSAANIKDARYWLQYIAQAGDALFQTPAHPKCTGQDKPSYYAHLIARGKIAHDEQQWVTTTLRGKELRLAEQVAG